MLLLLYQYPLGKYYTILPSVPNFNVQEFIKHFDAKLVPAGFNYNSGDNTEWETVTTLRQLIKEHVDSNFKA